MKQYNDWRDEHYKVISDFLTYLNKKTGDFILKGGTSLLTCYGLDRFSEDIDLDAKSKRNIEKIINDFCRQYNYLYRVPKDTDTTKRFLIEYKNEEKLLKIEVSYRRNYINENEITNINGINVYNINQICLMKANAYSGRDKIRDLYDICFICNNYWDKLSEDVKNFIRVAVEYKGIEQFEYIIKDQKDELINNEKLETDFLKTYERLGLLSENDNENNIKIEIQENETEDEDEDEPEM